MVLYPDGTVAPCCLLGNYTFGNIKEKSLDEIRNSESARALRREFIDGKIETCAQNIRTLGCNKWFEHLNDRIEISEIQSSPVVKLDLRLNGKCNLECVMCSVWRAPNGVYDQVGFWEQAQKDLFPYILELDVLGGEPFIQQDTYRLIDTVSTVNPNCRWAFTTNGHWKFTDRIRESLDRIELRWIIVSIDSLIPEVYSKIRLKGELARTLRTLEDLCAYRDSRQKDRPFPLCMEMVVQPLNYTEAGEYIRFARERGIQPGFTFLLDPAEQSPLILEAGERRRILDFYEDLYAETGEERLKRVITPLKDSFDSKKRLDWFVRQLKAQGF